MNILFNIALVLLAVYALYLILVLVLMQSTFNHYRKIERKIGHANSVSLLTDWINEVVFFHLRPIKTKTGNPTFQNIIIRYNSLTKRFWQLMAGFIVYGGFVLIIAYVNY